MPPTLRVYLVGGSWYLGLAFGHLKDKENLNFGENSQFLCKISKLVQVQPLTCKLRTSTKIQNFCLFLNSKYNSQAPTTTYQAHHKWIGNS